MSKSDKSDWTHESEWTHNIRAAAKIADDSAKIVLRDFFAGQALMGMHARDVYDNGQRTPEQRAALAYIDADAMLAERAKP